MRHAKAEQDGPTDFERPLADRGRRDAESAGAWLAEQDITPSHALVSAALRTEQTWESVASGAGWSLEADFDRGLYAAGPESALDLLRLVPSGVDTLIVIGHNPTIGMLAHGLDDGTGEPGASAEMVGGFPTGALAVFSYDGAWADLGEGTARLEAFHVGRG